VDGAGNVLVADAWNHTLRKITPAGTVTTLAGLARNYGCADGAGSQARFNRPSSIALDSATNLFVTDSLNHTIRKITPGGSVSTIAGLAGVWGSVDGTNSGARFFPAEWDRRCQCQQYFRGRLRQPDACENLRQRNELGRQHRRRFGRQCRQHQRHGSAARFSFPAGLAAGTAPANSTWLTLETI